MIHEHDDLILASAAIDFELTEAEAARLREAVADCPICAQRSAAYRRQFQLLADLPVLEPSAATRQAVMAAAISARQPRARAPMLLLAAALVIGTALALVAVAAGGAFKEKQLAEFPPINDPASPGPSAPAPSSTVPGPGASQPPGPGGGSTTFARDAIAEVVSSNLRLRSQPRIAADSIKFEPFLQDGDRLFVVDGPVVASGHDWYQVAVWRPTNEAASWPIGWVATADLDGTPWLAAAEQACPAAPTADVLAALNRAEALACYGHQTLTFRAVISGTGPTDPCPDGATTPCLGGPTWLAGLGGFRATPDARSIASEPPGPALAIARDPAGPVVENDFAPGRMVTISGAFDDPAAASCGLEGSPTSVSTLTATDAILRCRTTFVATSVVPDPGALTIQAAAITVTSGLRVRSLPLVDDTSERYDPLLDLGTRLYVVDGPVVGSGYDWYRVIVPAVTRAGRQPMIGWIAVASKTAEIWAQDVPLACPPVDGPVAVSELARLTTGPVSDGGVSCFGDVAVHVAANVTIGCPGPAAAASGSAGWLGEPARMTVRLDDAGAAFDPRIHPDLAAQLSCDKPAAAAARALVTGHFGDVAAEGCAAGAANADLADLARYRCRTVFVVTALNAAP